jgi:hypothetical protein
VVIHDVLGCPLGEVALMCGVGGNSATVLDDKGFSSSCPLCKPLCRGNSRRSRAMVVVSVPAVCGTKGGCGQQSYYIMDQLRYMGGMVGTGWWVTRLVCASTALARGKVGMGQWTWRGGPMLVDGEGFLANPCPADTVGIPHHGGGSGSRSPSLIYFSLDTDQITKCTIYTLNWRRP